MRIILVNSIAGLLAAALVSTVAMAQGPEEVTVKASRMTTQEAGYSSTGRPVVEITLSQRVGYKDLDLATNAGATELEKRVKKAARDACDEIDIKYPLATPRGEGCAKPAAEEAMVTVRELIAAARK